MINATMCFLRNNGETFFLYRNKGEGDIHHGWYVPPNNTIYSSFFSFSSASREFREETGLTLINPQLRVIATF